jgi:hypothetical protein
MTMQTVLRPTNTQVISVSGTAAENATAFKNSNITIYCATACYVKFGADNSVTATTTAGSGYDIFVPAGQARDISTGGAPYVSVILASGSDTVYINEWTHKAF